MTAAPPTSGLPTPPPGPAPQAPVPPRRPGYGLALTVAIVVSALPLLVVPIVGLVTAVSLAAVPAAIAGDLESYEEDPLGDLDGEFADDDYLPEAMLELPFDVEVDPAAYAAVTDVFVADAAWTASDAGIVSYTAWENSATGCIVSYLNGSLDPAVDVSQGDERASHSLIEWALETEVDPEAHTTTIATSDGYGGTGTGTADAVVEYFETDATHIAVLSRAFAVAGEGVIISVECPTSEAVDAAVATDLPAHLTLSLI
ncbi:hypothetical protein ACGGZK_02030 [Agromyces sp. MMS24-K17]|uniref:hypothetical protein n=1 Tax=Agromyces sp. MMS24-K17 TaxID=3372850 RepID=UPI003754DEBD